MTMLTFVPVQKLIEIILCVVFQILCVDEGRLFPINSPSYCIHTKSRLVLIVPRGNWWGTIRTNTPYEGYSKLSVLLTRTYKGSRDNRDIIIVIIVVHWEYGNVSLSIKIMKTIKLRIYLYQDDDYNNGYHCSTNNRCNGETFRVVRYLYHVDNS